MGIDASIGDNQGSPAPRPNLAIPGELMDWSSAFETALPYATFLDRHASPTQRLRWDSMRDRVRLDPDQLALLGGFVRRMPVVVLAGAWCGDCVNQCPIFDRFARASTAIDLRFLDRDALPEVADALSVNGGRRVPMVLFLSEDYREVARYGERTLSTYRRLAAEQLGPACPTGLVAPTDDATRLVTAEWLEEFERAQLILRLSPSLRARHGD
jgi:thiol-disulfide isomerase/thioredoxin